MGHAKQVVVNHVTAVDSLLNSHPVVRRFAAFGDHRSYLRRGTEAEIETGTDPKLSGRTPCDDSFDRIAGSQWSLIVAGVSHKGRVEISSIGLHLLGDGYYGIYQNSRDGDTAWTQNSGCNHFPHLCNNFSSAVVSSKCNRVAIKVSRFVFEGDISRRIRVGASDDANINFEGFVAKVFFTVELQQFYDVILCGIIHPSPA